MLRGACPQIAHSVYFGNSVLGADAIVAGDAVLVNSEDGKLYCVDGPSGKLRWAADDAGGSDASPVISNSGVRARFHAQLPCSFVCCSSRRRGTHSRTYDTSTWLCTRTFRVSSMQTLVFSGTSSGVCALRLVDGSRVWCTDLGEVGPSAHQHQLPRTTSP
jgi:outer membrane protein assembly factor BamB